MLCILTKKKRKIRIHSLNLKNIKNNMAIRNNFSITFNICHDYAQTIRYALHFVNFEETRHVSKTRIVFLAISLL